jgi:SAM-dependent methyltransferase
MTGVESASPDEQVRSQYASSTARLASRVSIYDYSTGPDWYPWVRERLPVADAEVLEVGAGTGNLWREWAGGPFSLVVTDAFAPMCGALRQVPAANVVQCRAEALPFRDASFAGVVANHVLYHLDDPNVGLSEMRRVCRDHGWVAVATNTARHFVEFADLMAVAGLATPGPPAHARFDADAALAAMQALTHGVVLHEYEADLEVPIAEPVLRYVFSVAPRNAEVEAALRLRLHRQIEADGGFRVRSSAVLLVGTASC